MAIYTSYETSKKLKEFLGESAPEQMGELVYAYDKHKSVLRMLPQQKRVDETPAYQLHDLLSKPFCEAIAKKEIGEIHGGRRTWGISKKLHEQCFNGGMEAVESALLKMMEAK